MPIETKNVLAKLSEKPSEELKPDEATETVTPAHPIDETEVANLIHKYAVFHAAVAFALGPIAGFALTLLTVKMISKIGERCNVGITEQGITNFVAHYGGFFAGIGLAQLILGLIPGIGNLSNAISSFVVTQIIGWATFTSFKRGGGFTLNLKKIDKTEWKKIISKIPVFKDMSDDEKERFAEWLVKLFNGANEQETKNAKEEIGNILRSYGRKMLSRYTPREIQERLNQFKEQLTNKWANRANDADYQEIEDKLLNIVQSEQFKQVREEDRTAFALNMATVLGTRTTEKKRREAQTTMKEILERYKIEF